jgi:hypothetical protein
MKTQVLLWIQYNFHFHQYLFFPPLAVQPNSGLCRPHETFRFTSVTKSRTVGRTPSTGDQLVARPLTVHKHRKTHTTQTLNIHALCGIQTHGPGVRASEDNSCLRPLGYRDRLASERAKTVHALDRSATVTGHQYFYFRSMSWPFYVYMKSQ